MGKEKNKHMCEILKIFALTYTHLHACCPQTSWHTVCYQEGLLKEPSLALCCRTAGTVLDKEMEAEGRFPHSLPERKL